MLRALACVLLFPGCIVYEQTVCAPCEGTTCGPGLSCVDGRCTSPAIQCADEDAAPSGGGAADGSVEADAAVEGADADRTDAVVEEEDAAPDAGAHPCAEGERRLEGRCRGPREIDVADAYACALWDDGRVGCWGFNLYGRLGADAVRWTSTPVYVDGLDDAVQISTGSVHACALRESGAVRCWGSDLDGRSSGADRPLPDGFVPRRVHAGDTTTCVLAEDGRARCWGAGAEGQLGLGFLDADPEPRFEAIDLGWGHACGLHEGEVVCWGGDNFGERGGAGPAPAPLDFGGAVAGIALATDLTCALLESGRLRCFGVPRLDEPGPYTSLSAGVFRVCATRASGEVDCFGYADTTRVPVAQPEAPPRADEQVVAGMRSGCYHAPGHAPRCWGGRGYGLLGPSGEPAPRPAVDEVESVQLAVGRRAACALDESGEVACWGLAWQGSLGRPAPPIGHAPAPVPDLEAVQISGAAGHTCAVGRDARVYCWGANAAGGALPGGPAEVPGATTPVPGLEDIEQVAAGYDFTCARSVGGEVWCFGAGGVGQLGGEDGPGPHRVDVPPAREVAAGGAFACAVVSDDEVWCWGADDRGQLNPGVPGESNAAPVQITGLRGVNSLVLGRHFACALHRDQTVSCWGGNEGGELGRGNEGRSGGVGRVPGLEGVVALDAGESHTCAADAEGAVSCFGYEASVRFGPDRFHGDTSGPLRRRRVTAIEGIADAIDLSVGVDAACARLRRDRLACFGLDEYGVVTRRGHDPSALHVIPAPRD